MKEIEGIVCTAKSLVPVTIERLFGPNRGGSIFLYENFRTNGLTPFQEIDEARLSLEELKGRRDLNLVSCGLAEIKMKIAQSDRDIYVIRDSSNLIIVAKIDFGEILLLGKKVEGLFEDQATHVSELELNGFNVIEEYSHMDPDSQMALYFVRKHFLPKWAYPATFELKRLND